MKGKVRIMAKVMVNGIEIGNVMTNRSLTITEAMYAIGYDINDPADCEKGYNEGVEGFYFDDSQQYSFDIEAAELIY